MTGNWLAADIPRPGLPGVAIDANALDFAYECQLSTSTHTSAMSDLIWHDFRALPPCGQGWPAQSEPWTRFPAHAEGRVPDGVWKLSRCSTGLYYEFETDATAMAVRWALGEEALALEHMPATGVSGLDLYEKTAHGWGWTALGRPAKLEGNEVELFSQRGRRLRRYRLYLPLYNGVSRLELGVPPDAAPRWIAPDPSFVCVYGTSVVQGACASRPGMAYPAILNRRFDLPFVNLGFSGGAKAERGVAELLCELRPTAWVVDCLPNVEEEGCRETLRVFLQIMAAAHARTPLLFVDFLNTPFSTRHPERSGRRETIRAAAREAFGAARQGDAWHWLDGDHLLGADCEDTVDGVHPTDLGFLRMARPIGDALQPLLPGGGGAGWNP